jgi:histidinol dehydrogenase
MVINLKSTSIANGIPSGPPVNVPEILRGIIDDIRLRGDEEARSYSERFDKWIPVSFKLSNEEIEAIVAIKFKPSLVL